MSTVNQDPESGLIEGEVLISLIVVSIILAIFAASLKQQLDLIRHTRELYGDNLCVEAHSVYYWCNESTQRRLQFKQNKR